ncbi:hypothetical protein RHSIM_RhsimUnG0202800 [Rhododendron simsii]|uniref:DUF659 domain-containing protein n=1 Tax=Rhododendron simsii TaxID=118357 RepID=A0A834L431_RHOSS|nr:hypothetical protein RHSIM_RhsimUnG0202800 [Rhododendron simsii]
MMQRLKVPDDVQKYQVWSENATSLLIENYGGPSGGGAPIQAVKPRGPTDKFPKAHQSTLKSKWKQDRGKKRGVSKDWTVHICKGTSDPFNIVNDHIDRKLFKELLYGPGFKSSSVHEMGTWILKSRTLLEHGFLKSVDESNAIKNANLMFNYLDGVIDEIGEANFLKVSTNNASNYLVLGGQEEWRYTVAVVRR